MDKLRIPALNQSKKDSIVFVSSFVTDNKFLTCNLVKVKNERLQTRQYCYHICKHVYKCIKCCLPFGGVMLAFLSVSLLKKQHKGVTGKSGSQENVPHENKSHFDEMIMISPLYLTNMLSWILLELAH